MLFVKIILVLILVLCLLYILNIFYYNIHIFMNSKIVGNVKLNLSLRINEYYIKSTLNKKTNYQSSSF